MEGIVAFINWRLVTVIRMVFHNFIECVFSRDMCGFYKYLECVFCSFLAPFVRTFHISLGLLLLQIPCLFPIWDRYVSVRTEKILADEKIASLGNRADSWMEKFDSM